MKLTATINVRITSDEIEQVKLLAQKHITQADIFRRGLDAYIADVSAMHPGPTSEEKK